MKPETLQITAVIGLIVFGVASFVWPSHASSLSYIVVGALAGIISPTGKSAQTPTITATTTAEGTATATTEEAKS